MLLDEEHPAGKIRYVIIKHFPDDEMEVNVFDSQVKAMRYYWEDKPEEKYLTQPLLNELLEIKKVSSRAPLRRE